ncbi:MAG: NAD-dependent deacetylase [delta proteobacterium ML8_F1]|nr:MAG: NAD-dependent deacetylase [delta proteobacterium ML8_F1]
MDSKKIEALTRLIQSSESIVFLGGAGTSTECGIPDFRSPEGLYNRELKGPSPEEYLSLDFFKRKTDVFYDYYKRLLLHPEARPGVLHHALRELEAHGKEITIITQNIDGLHQMAGSKRVIELHGSSHRNYCQSCRRTYSLEAVLKQRGVPHCDCGGVIRPDVVLYGEMLDEKVLEAATRAMTKADLLIVGGTSLSVYPAAGLIHYYQGGDMVIINQTPTQFDREASLIFREKISEVIKKGVSFHG